MEEIKQRLQQINIDLIGAGLSILCGIHCVVFPILMMAQPMLKDSFFFSEYVDQTIVIVSLLLASSSFAIGFNTHKTKTPFLMFLFSFTLISLSHFTGQIDEIIAMPIAGFTLAYAHIINHRLVHQAQSQEEV